MQLNPQHLDGNLSAAERDRASAEQVSRVERTFLGAYRWQYIVSGVQDERFGQVLGGMISREQAGRIAAALKPIVEA